MTMNAKVIMWFRRDLRLEDNRALNKALSSGLQVMPLFIFDADILDDLEDKNDARLTFIHDQLNRIHSELQNFKSALLVKHGTVIEVFEEILRDHEIKAVYANRDYEPYAIDRDRKVAEFLKTNGLDFIDEKDQVIFEKDEVTKEDGNPYTVFTPYSKKWKSKLETESLIPQREIQGEMFCRFSSSIPSLEDIGFQENAKARPFADFRIDSETLSQYAKKRDIPSLDATSHLSLHLRFGTVSIRKMVAQARAHSETFLNELIWREFFMQVLYHFPQVVHRSFRKKYDAIQWRNREDEFQAWCEGRTGFPLVDAGMRELNETGFMHNRIRMVTASFLVKDLLIDWRWGEAYFARKLLDYELSSNNGNWQWAAGTGCDAAPYFRIFNPESQAKKFDPDQRYICKWIPELDTHAYPSPIVDHGLARKRTLEAYQAI